MSDNTASAKANKSDQAKDPSFNMNELRELAGLVNEHGLRNSNLKMRYPWSALARPLPASPAPVYAGPAPAGATAGTASAPAVVSGRNQNSGAEPESQPVKNPAPNGWEILRAARALKGTPK